MNSLWNEIITKHAGSDNCQRNFTLIKDEDNPRGYSTSIAVILSLFILKLGYDIFLR